MSSEYEVLARKIAELERRIGNGGLGNSSLENSYVNEYDLNGILMSRWGQQYDGAGGIVNMNGPVPPIPGPPTITVVPGGLLVSVTGEFDPPTESGQPIVAPSDFARFEVHASTDPAMTGLLRTTMKATIDSPRGADLRIDLAYGLEFYVLVVTRSTAGRVSPPSQVLGPFHIPRFAGDDFDQDYIAEIGGNKIFFNPTAPVTTKVGDLWLKWLNSPTLPPRYETYRWDGDSWEKLEDQSVTDAALAAEAAQAAADLKTQLFVANEPPVGLGAGDTGIWIDSNDGNRSYTWSGVGWVSRRIANGAIEPGSLVASDVLATGTVSAALFEALMILANTIIVGDPSGEHIMLTGDVTDPRLAFMSTTPEGEPYEVTRFGKDSAGTDTTGNTVWQIDEDGVATFQELSVNSDPLIEGIPLSELLAAMGGGFVAGGSIGALNDPAATPAGGGENDLYEMAVEVFPDHIYMLQSSNIWVRAGTSCNRIDLNLRYTVTASTTSAPPAVSITSPYWLRSPAAETASIGHSAVLQKIFRPATYLHFRFLLSLFSVGGTAFIEMGSALNNDLVQAHNEEPDLAQLWVTDLGLRPWTNRAALREGGGGVAAPAAKQKYTYTYEPHWSRRFRGDGTVHSDNDHMAQGFSPFYTANGNQGSQVGDFRRVGTSIGLATDLAGSTIESFEVYLYANHWHYASGGTGVVRYHNNTAPGVLNNYAGDLRPGFTRAQGRWIRQDSWGPLFRDGAAKGVQIGPAPTTDPIYYGVFGGVSNANPPLIRVTFSK